MKWILVWVMLVSGFMSNAQQGQAPQQEAPYKRSPTIPALELLRPDSTKFTKDDLKKQNTLIMYFSPDCDHCIHQTEDMIKRMDDLKKLQILMITHQPMNLLVDFIKKYKLTNYANIKVAQDNKMVLPGFYRMKTLPYFALYDKDGNLITTFESNQKVDTLLKAFQK